MQSSSTVRKRHTPAQREKILGAYRRSRVSQREFCAQAGIGLSTLQLWLRKSARGAAAPAGFIELPPVNAAPTPGSMYRVHFRNGTVVEVGAGFGAEELRALLQLLPA